MKRKAILIVFIFGVLLTVWVTTVVFIVPPIGAVPEGKTIVLFKPDRLLVQGKFDFLETPDHFQYKNLGKVNLFGRLAAIGAILNGPIILARLPYSSTLEYLANAGSSWE